MSNQPTPAIALAEELHIDYAIYPSLLDSFLRFKRTDGDETFAALLDKINGVKSEQTEAQLKGVEFEKCVNDLIDGTDVQLAEDANYIKTANFTFPIALVQPMASKLRHCTGKQEYIEAIIETRMGRIKLYGIVDYTFDGMLADLKSTGNYKVNKYTDAKEIKYTQHLMYPLIRKQMGVPVKAFKYVITDFENDYQETYVPSENMDFKLMQIIFEFIRFINYYKPNITNMKVFGGEVQS